MATLKMAGTKTVTIELQRDIVERATAAFPGVNLDELVRKALARTIGEAELKQFAAAKQAEVQAEAQRLNEELGLA